MNESLHLSDFLQPTAAPFYYLSSQAGPRLLHVQLDPKGASRTAAFGARPHAVAEMLNGRWSGARSNFGFVLIVRLNGTP